MGWMHAKLGLVFLLLGYHVYLGKLLFDFKHDKNKHGDVFYRVLNEIPVAFLVAIIILAVVKPW
jgi:putative membrane protein